MRFLFEDLQLLDARAEILSRGFESSIDLSRQKLRHLFNIQQGRDLGLQFIDGSFSCCVCPLIFIGRTTHRCYGPPDSFR
jgi:hypothetical protein